MLARLRSAGEGCRFVCALGRSVLGEGAMAGVAACSRDDGGCGVGVTGERDEARVGGCGVGGGKYERGAGDDQVH